MCSLRIAQRVLPSNPLLLNVKVHKVHFGEAAVLSVLYTLDLQITLKLMVFFTTCCIQAEKLQMPCDLSD